MNLEMTFDDFKSKTMKDKPDQKPNGKKAKGLHFLSSRWWCPAAVTLGILCLGLLVTLILLAMQCKYWNRDMMKEKVRTYKHGLLIGLITTTNNLDLDAF